MNRVASAGWPPPQTKILATPLIDELFGCIARQDVMARIQFALTLTNMNPASPVYTTLLLHVDNPILCRITEYALYIIIGVGYDDRLCIMLPAHMFICHI